MRFFFDQRDFRLIQKVNELSQRDQQPQSLRALANPYLHPHGIKEMAANSDVRIANAAISLLHSIEAGQAPERLRALRSLQDEVIHSSQTVFRRNTARAMLAVMKDLVRSREGSAEQLRLAHDFHVVASGKPRTVRAMLRKYHLLEMNEEWNQAAFDDHVHDANTKGRKSPTHLVMDAWIKGIRYLTVIYYNHVRDEVATELLEAAEIMGVKVRISIERPTLLRNKYVRLIWIPRGFVGQKDFMNFLAQPQIREFMKDGNEISRYHHQFVFKLLEHFNEKHRISINSEFGIDLEKLDVEEFTAFVNAGQPSLLHMAEFIHKKLLERFKEKIAAMRSEMAHADGTRRGELQQLVKKMNLVDSVTVWERYLKPSVNPELPNPNVPSEDSDVPVQLNRSARELIDSLHGLFTGYRLTLNLSNLTTEDVLELLYEGRGRISHLEIFNLKDFANGKDQYWEEIDHLRHVINTGNIIGFKRLSYKLINRLTQNGGTDSLDRIEKLRLIQSDVGRLFAFYKGSPLSARIGSDSAGRSKNIHGMGLAILKTLPRRAQKEIKHSKNRSREVIPVHMSAAFRVTYQPPAVISHRNNGLLKLMRKISGLRGFGMQKCESWVIDNAKTQLSERGNVSTLGGLRDESGNNLSLVPKTPSGKEKHVPIRYLRTSISNSLKILLGFVPAFLTFLLTKDWWLLAYFGAFIWFGITSLRNILQSVLGGGGFRRSPLLRWNDHVSWGRIADSLMYTGFSVPLLDYLVKTLLLQHGFNMTASTNPYIVYSVIAAANGLYIASHNAIRGLPKGAIMGNLFRTVLSIPVAVVLNSTLGMILNLNHINDVASVLQNWAAVISKFASDIVAGFIEGTADRFVNLEQRLVDFTDKINQVIHCHSELEIKYPQKDIISLMEAPREFSKTLQADARELEKTVIINALDMLYFYMFLPRGRTVLKWYLCQIGKDDRQVLLRSQRILKNKKEVSQYIVDGLIGKNFTKGLAFYLQRADDYLIALKSMGDRAKRKNQNKI